MSISGILSNNSNQYQIGVANSLQQQFQQLGQALQSGNLSASQSDFATLRAAFSQPSSTTGAGSSTPTSSTATSPVNQAFSQLASDLQSGNLSAAQKDYSILQQDSQKANGTPAFPNFPPSHRHGGAGGFSTGGLQDFSQVGQNFSSSSSPSGNLVAAQQSYITLEQQLQQFALGGVALNSELPISFDA